MTQSLCSCEMKAKTKSILECQRVDDRMASRRERRSCSDDHRTWNDALLNRSSWQNNPERPSSHAGSSDLEDADDAPHGWSPFLDITFRRLLPAKWRAQRENPRKSLTQGDERGAKAKKASKVFSSNSVVLHDAFTTLTQPLDAPRLSLRHLILDLFQRLPLGFRHGEVYRRHGNDSTHAEEEVRS